MKDPADLVTTTAEHEALRWLVDFEDLSEVEQARFQAWLDKDPEHWLAFEKLEREWRRMGVLRRLATATPRPDTVDRWLRRRRLLRRYLPLAAAAGLAAMSLFLLPQPNQTYAASFRTAIGQHEKILLPDGSVMTLNTDSGAVVGYGVRERRVRLLAGEAHFIVAEAPERPFVVVAGSGLVRAIGTAFNVNLKGDAVEVTVTEGVVEVLPKALLAMGDGGKDRAGQGQADPNIAVSMERLGKGEKIEYGNAIQTVSRVGPQELVRQRAWRAGMLDFRGATLAEVIEEAGRYTETRIVIADPEIGDLHVTGYLKAGDIETLLKLLESNEQVAVRRVTPTLVHVTANRR